MPPLFRLLVSVPLLTIALAPGCGGVSSPGGGNCQGGICVRVELAEPVPFNQPVAVTITIETERHIRNLGVFLSTDDPDNIIAPAFSWTVDAVAGQPLVLTSTVTFPEEGYTGVIVHAQDPARGRVVGDSVSVHITRSGGTVNPTVPVEGQPIPFTPRAEAETPPPPPTPVPYWASVGAAEGPNVPIPDDGSWLTYTAMITTAHAGAVVQGVSLELGLIHDRAQDLVFEVIGPDGVTAQRVWDRPVLGAEDQARGGLPEGPFELDAFAGLPADGTWTLRVRDEARGVAGRWRYYVLKVRYVVTPSSQSTAPPAHELAGASTAGSWQQIASETFEGLFPSAGWTVQDLSADGFERYWDDDDYRAHWGSWAAWPANGGVDGVDPALADHDYPANVDTRMIYGPFDLSDAVEADTDFYLWGEMESCCDYVAFEISHDGVAFEELARWTGAQDWQFEDVYYNDYAGDESVWVAWRFVSDYSICFRPGSRRPLGIVAVTSAWLSPAVGSAR